MCPTFSSHEASRIRSTRSWSPWWWEPSNTQRSSRICWPVAATTSRGNRLWLPVVTYVCFLCDQAVSCLLRGDSSVRLSATEHLCLLSRAIRNIILLAITLVMDAWDCKFDVPSQSQVIWSGWSRLSKLNRLANFEFSIDLTNSQLYTTCNGHFARIPFWGPFLAIRLENTVTTCLWQHSLGGEHWAGLNF